MPLNIPRTTLFMLTSLDGKISTGSSEAMDFDQDLPKLKGIKEGLHQYYDLEKKTDICSFNTGRVMAKIGINQRKTIPPQLPVTFILIDNKPHLKKPGLIYLSKWLKQVYIVTTNKNHPAYQMPELGNITIIHFPKKIDLKKLFTMLKTKFNINRLTIQSGGTMNTALVREGLVERVSIVVAPCLVGGQDTATLLDGPSLSSAKELQQIKSLSLQKVTKLKESYLHLLYKVNN